MPLLPPFPGSMPAPTDEEYWTSATDPKQIYKKDKTGAYSWVKDYDQKTDLSKLTWTPVTDATSLAAMKNMGSKNFPVYTPPTTTKKEVLANEWTDGEDINMTDAQPKFIADESGTVSPNILSTGNESAVTRNKNTEKWEPKPTFSGPSVAPTWLDNWYESLQKQHAEAKTYNDVKTIGDVATGGLAYLSNAFAKKEDLPAPPMSIPAVYGNIYGSEKGLVDNALALSLGTANKVSRELGKPEYIGSNLGTMMDAQAKAYAGIAQDVSTIDQANRKSVAEADTANSLASYTTEVANNAALKETGLMRSQTMAAQLTANSKMINDRIKNKFEIDESMNQQTMYYNLIKNGASTEEALAMMKLIAPNLVTETAEEDYKTIYDKDGNITGYTG